MYVGWIFYILCNRYFAACVSVNKHPLYRVQGTMDACEWRRFRSPLTHCSIRTNVWIYGDSRVLTLLDPYHDLFDPLVHDTGKESGVLFYLGMAEHFSQAELDGGYIPINNTNKNKIICLLNSRVESY